MDVFQELLQKKKRKISYHFDMGIEEDNSYREHKKS